MRGGHGTGIGVEAHDRAGEPLCAPCAEAADGIAAWLELQAPQLEPAATPEPVR